MPINKKNKVVAHLVSLTESNNIHTTTAEEREWLKELDKCTSFDKEHLFSTMLKCQNTAINEAIKVEADIPIPKIGRLRIKPVRRKLIEYKKKLYESKGVISKSELSEADATEIKNLMAIKAKELINAKRTAKANKTTPFVNLSKIKK